MDEMEITTVMGIAGFVIGLVFGATTHRTNFCVMGSISDVVSFGNFQRARSWILAIATAMLGANLLQFLGVIDLGESIYLGASINWGGAIAGGLVFGFGMVLSSGCPGKNLARTGSGDLKALTVLLFIGIFGYMTLRGIIAPARLLIEGVADMPVETQQIGLMLANVLGMEGEAPGLILAIAVAAALLVFAFAAKSFRESPRYILGGVIIGACVVAGWYATGVLGADDFDPQPLTSLTFIAPTGTGLQYLMTFTGATINFGIASVGGAILGAFLAALGTGTFRLTAFYDVPDTVRHMIGGAMMGIGGVIALGCTIGQGITGISTLSLGSLVAVLSIVAGGYLGVKYMERVIGL